jgi:hypothetical protein
MAYATPDLAPGYYLEGITVNVDFDQSVINVVQNLDGIPPALSKYIAYDTLTPANPFLAVTQDGRGNVVYDGGFPKFYNSSGSPAGSTTFAELNGAGKFFYNAMNFIANASKVAAGNRKILIVGDKTVSPYWVKGSEASDFFNTFSLLGSVGNWTFTFKDANDWGGNINFDLAELEQYVAVVVMSSLSDGSVRITNNAVTDLVTYRANGSGLMFITDHGRDVTSTTDALTPATNTFFNMANKVMVNFGAWFSGNIDRSPVNVGYLRTTYGDHPLYNGLLDSEDIYAGSSESRVYVTTYPELLPGNVPVVEITEPGTHRINLLVELTDGSVHTYQLVYVIATGAIVAFRDASDTIDVNELNIAYSDVFDPVQSPIVIRGTDLGTLTGTIKRNGVVIGELLFEQTGGQTVKLFAGDSPIRVSNGDVIEAKITSPFEFTSTLTVSRFQPQIESDTGLAEVIRKLDSASSDNRRTTLTRAVSAINSARPEVQLPYRPSPAEMLNFIRRYMRNEEILPPVTVRLYADNTALNNALSSYAPTDPNLFTLGDVLLNQVYRYNTSWSLLSGRTLHSVFGAPRVLINELDSAQYRLNLNGTITPL